ncbi:MAG: hypothetical protein IPL46_07585 [Saprospiraceae bacterium]|nr:hypothetical protein [Saprospiraceae bacterium]
MIAILFSLVFIFACSAGKSIIRKEEQVYNTDFQYEDDQVLVLLIDLLPNEARLRRTRIVAGDFRPVVEPLKQKEAVRVQYLDDRNQILLEKIMDHPLFQYKEYSDEGGRLQYIRVEEEKGSMLLRTQYSKAIKSIRIDYGDDNTYRKISQLSLSIDD